MIIYINIIKCANNNINLQEIDGVVLADCKLNISRITKMLLQLRTTTY